MAANLFCFVVPLRGVCACRFPRGGGVLSFVSPKESTQRKGKHAVPQARLAWRVEALVHPIYARLPRDPLIRRMQSDTFRDLGHRAWRR